MLNESKIQAAFHKYMRYAYPDVMAFAVPNGAWLKGNYGHAMRLKAEGMVSGVPDYWIIHQNSTYCGLVIEFKYGSNKVSKQQSEYIQYLNRNGLRAVVCYSVDEAIYEVEQYMTDGKI
jgi:hypothetical protein